MDADAEADATATAPAGRGPPPRPISPPRLDSDAPPHGAPGEAESDGIGQDAVPALPVAQNQVGFYLGGAGRQVLGDDRDGDHRHAVDGDRVGERVAVADDHQVPDAARFVAVPPGGDPAGDDVDLQVLPEQHAVGLDHDGADHVGERVAEDPQGIEAGGDGITPDALPLVGHGGNGIGAANQGLGVGRAALPPRGRGRGGEHRGAALPPRGRGRGGDPRANVVDLYGPSANRPDAKGRTIPRLGRKFESEDDRTTSMNYQLRTLYRQLQDRKADAREADETSGRKAALAIVKQYEEGLSKAEGMRRQIARAGAIPVDKHWPSSSSIMDDIYPSMEPPVKQGDLWTKAINKLKLICSLHNEY